MALRVPVWKAFKVAESTMCLSWEAAVFVDRALAPVLSSCSFAQIERTVATAIDRHDPDEAERRRQRAADDRCFDVHLSRRSGATEGTVAVTGTLDLLDALDLEDAIKQGARALGDLGCGEPLDVRRSLAVGEMARNQLALDLSDTHEAGAGRGVTVHAHVSPDQAHADVDNPGAGTVLIEQLLEWCTRPGTNVSIQPVIDLNEQITSAGYTPSPRLTRQVRLRDRTCVFPYCTTPAARCDLDHRVPYDRADPDKGGPTSSSNLAPLCRRHHRAKTHSSWASTSPRPGVYDWTTPTGARFRVTTTSTPSTPGAVSLTEPDPPPGQA